MSDASTTMNPYEVISRYQMSPPVDVKAVAEALGARVWESVLPSSIAGKLIPDEINGGWAGFSILVNSLEALNRKRFTIAHEIAHLILHKHLIESGIIEDALYRSGLGGSREIQANRLAAEILMPRHLVSNYLYLGVDELAGKLQVSRAAMDIRLSALGIR